MVARWPLIEHAAQTDKAGALAWLVDARLIAAPGGPDARPANRGIPCHNSRSAPMRPDSGPAAPGSPPDRALSGPVSDSREQSGTWTPPESAAPALAPPAPTPSVTADVARAVLQNADEADATPARAYLAARGTWPADGPALPAAVRWLPPEAVADLPTWPGPDGRQARLTPPRDGVRSLRPDAPPVPRCGAVVFELARPGCAPDAVTLEAVTAAGARPAERWRRSPGGTGGRTFTVPAPSGDGWPSSDAAPLAVAVVEGEADAPLRLRRIPAAAPSPSPRWTRWIPGYGAAPPRHRATGPMNQCSGRGTTGTWTRLHNPATWPGFFIPLIERS